VPPANDYEYDVFISYRRAGNAQHWVEEHFAPTLEDCLATEMVNAPRLFFDQQLEIGTTWPPDLGAKLANSRMLLSLWSKNYLSSLWCTMELAHMLAREEECGLRSATNPSGLVVIGVINDGEKMPADLGAIQKFEISNFFNTRMRKDSEAAADLEAALRSHAPTLAQIIENAPKFQPAWTAAAASRFFKAFKQTVAPSQDVPPSFTQR
jgi:hypothetical protein